MKSSEINTLSVEKMKEMLEETRRELFSMRLNATTAHVKDYSQFKKKRKDIARLLTCIRKQNHV